MPSTVDIASCSVSFLTLPSELRNVIYMHIFRSEEVTEGDRPSVGPPEYTVTPIDYNLTSTSLQSPQRLHPARGHVRQALNLLETCQQIHREAQTLAFSHSNFHISSICSDPELFKLRSARLPHDKLLALRTLTLTARISHLRALNEAWAGLPFGCSDLRLDALILVPYRADVTSAPLREIADMSQCHTLAYVLGETLKGLRNVGYLEVRNAGCFDGPVWAKMYCSLVYRLWRWGGGKCGIRFETGRPEEPDRVGIEEHRWLRAHLRDRIAGVEVGAEVCRLVGRSGEYPFDPARRPVV